MQIRGSRVMASAIGTIRLEASRVGVTRVEILPSTAQTPPVSIAVIESRQQNNEEYSDIEGHLEAAQASLARYFEEPSMTPQLALDIKGTDFQMAVWEEIRRLESGETSTYAEIAARVQNPKAVRAVGSAVGSNPVPLLIGCHRVLGSGGRITGYSGGDGLATKRLLLNLERIEFRE